MKIVSTIQEYDRYRQHISALGGTLGFVPTMGALHEGHLSLVRRSLSENEFTVVSIFVNPTQFNDPEDYQKYPRDDQQDIQILGGVLGEEDLVFLPGVKEIYPQEDTRYFSFGAIESVMEGASRPGHFNGVAQVVSRLFDVVKPHKAYFGEKDYQQLLIVRQMVTKTGVPVEIIPCPIVRELDGLAMSSRNQRLSEEERQEAGNISKTLSTAKLLCDKYDIRQLKNWVKDQFEQSRLMELEYFEVADGDTLQPLVELRNDRPAIAFIAARIGNIRLIDNIKLNC